MAQHIDKQKPHVSSTINALKSRTKLESSPHGVLMQPREKIDKTINDTQKVCILSNSAEFPASQPLLPAYNF